MRRSKMIRSFAAASPLPAASPVDLAPASAASREALGEILFSAYEGGPDQEENDAAEGTAEIARTLDGGYGPLVDGASFVAREQGAPIGAVLVVSHRETTLLAHLVVAPRAQGRGVGSALVVAALDALARMGHRELALAVHPASRAKSLYARLGFVEVPVS